MKKRLLVSIIGGSGSGKTTIIAELKNAFSFRPAVLSMDNYYLPKSQQKRDENNIWNFDLPEAFDLDRFHKDVLSLLNGKGVDLEEYIFENFEKTPEVFQIDSSEIIFIEGIFVLFDERIKNLVDLQIFIHADDEVRIERRLKRDSESRGLSAEMINYQWKNHVCPAHDLYVAKHKDAADIFIDNSIDYKEDLEKTVKNIMERLEQIANT